MKRLLIVAAALCALAACAPKAVAPKVMARLVPERADDFAWENDKVAYRAYGEALETLPGGALTSPGFDVWVKNVPELVMDQRYKDDLENGISYHKDHGNGKDCYKVGVTLGGGASVPYIDGALCWPATNFRSSEVVEQTADKVVFVLHYPEWEVAGYKIALDKKITVEAGTWFCIAEDTWTFEGPTETLPVAAGIVLHDVQDYSYSADRVAIWEKASDTGAEPEDSCLGLAVVMDGASYAGPSADGTHAICVREVRSGETLKYRFGSCWSKADVATPEEWMTIVGKI